MRPSYRSIAAVALVVLGAASCRSDAESTAVAYALRRIVADKPVLPVSAAVWTDVQAFYEQRHGAPAWVNDEDLTMAGTATRVLQAAPEHGLRSGDYGEAQLAQNIEAIRQLKEDADVRVFQLAQLDARLTTALLALGRDVALGRSKHGAVKGVSRSRRKAPNLAGSLAAAGSDLNGWLNSVRPRHPEYAALQQALANLLAQKNKGGWPKVPSAKFAVGRPNNAVVALRQRLAASGHLSAQAASNPSLVYSSDDAAGVKAFQNLHGMKPSGVATAEAVAAMNVPLDERIRQVSLNLERWRWMPDDLGARHFLVNVPYFHLIARENGQQVMDVRVVVGTPENKTPLFSSEMTTVVFSPYWNIPDTIVEGETAPAVARDPTYLARNNIEILDVSRSGARPIDYSSVNWEDSEQLKHLAFRQRPGPGNALGHVKFLFPNDFDVYLHDTPADALFARTGRAFSHGCVRVEEPEALAKYVLRGYPEWNDQRILEAMHAGVEKHVKLHETIPVHIVYFTSWVDPNGGLHFQPDVYGYDGESVQPQ
jgi:murein L,D-transpeptidase YcbB/YkuD